MHRDAVEEEETTTDKLKVQEGARSDLGRGPTRLFIESSCHFTMEDNYLFYVALALGRDGVAWSIVSVSRSVVRLAVHLCCAVAVAGRRVGRPRRTIHWHWLKIKSYFWIPTETSPPRSKGTLPPWMAYPLKDNKM